MGWVARLSQLPCLHASVHETVVRRGITRSDLPVLMILRSAAAAAAWRGVAPVASLSPVMIMMVKGLRRVLAESTTTPRVPTYGGERIIVVPRRVEVLRALDQSGVGQSGVDQRRRVVCGVDCALSCVRSESIETKLWAKTEVAGARSVSSVRGGDDEDHREREQLRERGLHDDQKQAPSLHEKHSFSHEYLFTSKRKRVFTLDFLFHFVLLQERKERRAARLGRSNQHEVSEDTAQPRYECLRATSITRAYEEKNIKYK